MIIVHTPDGGEVERFDVRSIRTSEASIITRLITADLSWQQIKARAGDSDPDALRAIAFVIKKRTAPSLRVEDFDPLADELQSKLDHKEIDTWAEIAAERLATFEGPVEAARPALAVILDEADDTAYAEGVIERILAGKFPAAPEETTSGGDQSMSAPSTSAEPTISGSLPTSSTSTEDDSTTS